MQRASVSVLSAAALAVLWAPPPPPSSEKLSVYLVSRNLLRGTSWKVRRSSRKSFGPGRPTSISDDICLHQFRSRSFTTRKIRDVAGSGGVRRIFSEGMHSGPFFFSVYYGYLALDIVLENLQNPERPIFAMAKMSPRESLQLKK